MWWLWIVGPFAVLLVYVLTGMPRDERARRRREASSWRANEGGGAKAVSRPAGELGRALAEAGGGVPIVTYELYPRLAYLSVVEADATSGSNHQTVVAKLDDGGPTFVARPLPIIEGVKQANTGIAFPKDEEFAAEYLVTGEATASIKKWLSRPVRKALLELPGAWLRVEGKTMALTLYGNADRQLLDDLVVTADAIFAEHGAEGGPSLLGPDEDEEAAKPAPKAKAATPKKKPAAKPAATKTKSAATEKDA